MKLSTIVPIQPLVPQIDYESKILCLGSCFAENIGKKLQHYGFDTVINPFGIIFNPASLATLVERCVNEVKFTKKDVESTFSYFAHSDLNGSNEEETVSNLNKALPLLRERIENSSHIFITLGTAWVYRHVDRDMIVANCHKQPQSAFSKQLLTANQINLHLESIEEQVEKLNPDCTICFTLSPVRHLKDGHVENMRSKSRLHDAIQHQVDQGLQYFPAYEIVMDELRDYRFYKPDMIHLNETGTDYVWLCFRESGINKNTYDTMNAVEKYQRLAAHRPKNPDLHRENVEVARKELLEKHPYLSLS